MNIMFNVILFKNLQSWRRIWSFVRRKPFSQYIFSHFCFVLSNNRKEVSVQDPHSNTLSRCLASCTKITHSVVLSSTATPLPTSNTVLLQVQCSYTGSWESLIFKLGKCERILQPIVCNKPHYLLTLGNFKYNILEIYKMLHV